MVNPSGIRHTKNDDLEINEVRQGLYTVKNAYEGVYEYFKNRPILVTKEKPLKLKLEERDRKSDDL
ncbi:MAG TPA: hypothetical protein V6D50_01665 [Chroococcales cyanobacterium]|jgi:hypothetical protein